MADLDSEPDLDMTGVEPVLPATRNAPAAEAGVGTGGVSAVSTPAVTPKMTAPAGGAATATPATPAMAAAVQAAASAAGTFSFSQGRRRGAYSISASPPNSRADARGLNHGTGL